jgi:hypothetical protein
MGDPEQLPEMLPDFGPESGPCSRLSTHQFTQMHFCTFRAVDSRTVKTVEVWTSMSKCEKALKNRQII